MSAEGEYRRVRPEPECISDEVAAIMRRKTPAEKIAMIDDLWAMARSLIKGHVRSEHPEWSEERITREIARRMSHETV